MQPKLLRDVVPIGPTEFRPAGELASLDPNEVLSVVGKNGRTGGCGVDGYQHATPGWF